MTDLASRIAALAEEAERLLAASDAGTVYHGDEVEHLAKATRLALRAFKAERLLRQSAEVADQAYRERGYGHQDDGDALERHAHALLAAAEALVREG